jgi:hypothetical protein
MKTKTSLIVILIITMTLAMSVAAAAADEPSGWAKAEVEKAIGTGLIKEELQNNYRANITRKDFCAMIMTLIYKQSEEATREIVLTENVFEDTAADEVLAAYALGIVEGKAAGIFDPEGAILRQEAAAMLTRTAKVLEMDISANVPYFADTDKISGYAKESVDFVYKTGIMKGTGGGMFSPAGLYTREQAYMTALRLYNTLNGVENAQTPVADLNVRIINSTSYGEPVLLSNGFLYYIGNDDNMYRVHLTSQGSSEKLFKLDEDEMRFAEPVTYQDIAILNMHYGTASIGHYTSTIILPDGGMETIRSNVMAYAKVNGYDVEFDRDVAIGWGDNVSLRARADNESEFHDVGEVGVSDSWYSYGVYATLHESGEVKSRHTVSDFAVFKDEVFIIAQYYDGKSYSHPGVYKVDVASRKTERVIENPAIRFKMNGDCIYFLGEDNLLYKSKFGEDTVRKVSDRKMRDFFLLGNEVFYWSYDEWKQYRLGDDKVINDTNYDSSLRGIIAEEYFTWTAPITPGSDKNQGFVVDKTGNVFKSDIQYNVRHISVYGGTIWIVI